MKKKKKDILDFSTNPEEQRLRIVKSSNYMCLQNAHKIIDFGKSVKLKSRNYLEKLTKTNSLNA